LNGTVEPRERHEVMTRSTFQILATVTVVFATTLGLHAQSEAGSMKQQASYRTVTVDGVSIFYREVGPKELLLFFCCTVFHPHHGCFSLC